MGQSQLLTCQNQDQGFFLHEIRVYKWRADPNFNIYLPRVSFKSAYQQLQQERYSLYLQQHEQKDYL